MSTAEAYIVLPGARGNRVASFVDDTALYHCTKVWIGGGDRDDEWWNVDLLRPFDSMSTGERILWRTALWAADINGDRPTHTEAKAALDADNYREFCALVAERERGEL